MANYATLKSTIEDNIKQNGIGAITGPVLQSALLSMINSLGVGYQFMGIATTSTNPGTPDQNVFYLAAEKGNYVYFDVELDGKNVCALKYNGAWSVESIAIASEQLVFNKIPFTSESGGIAYNNGNEYTVASRMRTDFIDISNVQEIIYTREMSDGTGSPIYGMAFYDSLKQYISGIPDIMRAAKESYTLEKVSVPASAKYVRFSYWANNGAGLFFFADAQADIIAQTLYECFVEQQENTVIFEQGGINSDNGNLVVRDERIRSSYIKLSGRLIMSVSDGYVIRSINYYDEDKVWFKGVLYKTEIATTEQQTKPAYIRVVVNKTDDTQEIAPGAPIEFTINQYASTTDPDVLQQGTFNSSYSEIDTKPIRDKFCRLLIGTNSIETFLFFSDPHLTSHNRYGEITEKERDMFIGAMQKYYNSLPIDFCICGGDWINYVASFEEGCEDLGYQDGYMRKLFKNYRPVMGNHDNFVYSYPNGQPTYKISDDEVRNLAFRENGAVYYSWDGINTKFYVLNTGISGTKTMDAYRWGQVDWFARKLLADNPEHAIILSHIFSNADEYETYPRQDWFEQIHQMPDNVVKVAVAFNNRQSITLNGQTYDFSEMTGNVACYLVGHTHFDMVDCTHEIPVIAITTLQGGYFTDNLDGTGHAYSHIPTFDCCVCDHQRKKLSMVRVGSQVSRTIHTEKVSISSGETEILTPSIVGTLSWYSEDADIVSVNGGTITGVSAGIAGIRAIQENGDEEYWIIKVL